MEINDLGKGLSTLGALAWHIADDSGDLLKAPESAPELSEIIMEINELGMRWASLRAPAWKQALAASDGLGMEVFITFDRSKRRPRRDFHLRALCFLLSKIICFSFYASRIAAGRPSIFLIAGTILPQVRKNEKPTVGI